MPYICLTWDEEMPTLMYWTLHDFQKRKTTVTTALLASTALLETGVL